MSHTTTDTPQDWNYFTDEKELYAWAINNHNGTVIRACKMKSEHSIMVVPNNFKRAELTLTNCLEHHKQCTDADFVKIIGLAASAIDNIPFV